MRYELTDCEWAIIKPFLPTNRAACRGCVLTSQFPVLGFWI